MEAGQNPSRKFNFLAAGAIALTGLAVVLPFLHFGVPSGHDFEFHFNSWVEVVDDWRHFNFYPHWNDLAHFGYGEARFIFYPPISWTLGAGLGALLPWKLVPAAYIWIALSLSGASMFVLARRWFSPANALFAAVIYAANPYHLVIVYWRSALAELLAAAYLPLLFLYALRSEEDGSRVIAPLSLLLAAGWLTNVPSAVMMNYSLALLLLCLALRKRSFAMILYGCAAVVLGAAIAGIYLAPVWHQHSWVSLDQVLSPGVRPQDNFLFVITRDPEHNQFNRVVSVVALWELAILAGAFILSRKAPRARFWLPLVVWSAVSAILMIQFTLPLWMHSPELRFVQLPWRWLLCINVALAMAIVLAFQRMWLRILICAIALGSVALAWHQILNPWWDHAPDLQEMVDNQQDGVGNDGTDEYVPVAADSYDVDQSAPRVQFKGSGSAKIRVEEWQEEQRRFVATATSPGKLLLRLFNYPCWKVEVNGTTVPTETTPHTGLMVIPIPAGEDRVRITWVEGWDRRIGGMVSIFGLVVVVITSRRGSHSLRLKAGS